MLTARKAPRACQVCRRQLWTLFEHGFTGGVTSNASRPRCASTLASRPRNTPIYHSAYVRYFSGTQVPNEEAKDVPSQVPTAAEIEAVVVQARQTFGETLPNNYLSKEEYILYERLYGPPLRETKPDDLEYLPEAEEDMTPPGGRNAVLRGDYDNFEEVYLDEDVTFSVVENEGEELQTPDAEEAIDDPGLEAVGVADSGVTEEVQEVESEVFSEEYDVDDEYMENSDAVSKEESARIKARNQREQDVIARLQRDMEAVVVEPAEAAVEEDAGEEYVEEEDWEEDEPDMEFEEEDDAYAASGVKAHPNTLAGRFGPPPSTVHLPHENLVAPVTELLARTNWGHLKDAAETAFGGTGLPYSTSTPRSKKLLPQKHIGLDAFQHSMSEIEADAYISTVVPGMYASVMGTIVEVRKRLGKDWIRDMLFRQDGVGPRILDAGAGGAGILAWREVLQAEWDVLKEEGAVDSQDNIPVGKTTILTGASTLRHRVSRFIENASFIPRLPDYIHASNSGNLRDADSLTDRKSYDLIIAPHTLFPLKEDFRRKNMVQNLWSLLDPNGGVLILLEKGLPRGFEAIAGARHLLLEKHISSPGQTEYEEELQSNSKERFVKKETGMIIAPCTNHKQCPMDPVPGFSYGRKDFCHFRQRYIRPPYLQRILGAAKRNHEDAKFSYIAVRRGVDSREDLDGPIQGDIAADRAFEGYENEGVPEAGEVAFNALSLPRQILPPLKRRGHVTLDLCTPAGNLERWVVPKSFSKTAYHDARKSSWGDLWALGAKTRTVRKVRLGSVLEDGGKMKGLRDGKKVKAGKNKKNKFDLIMGRDGVLEGIEMDRTQAKRERVKPKKRTKGGRVWKDEKPITEDDLG